MQRSLFGLCLLLIAQQGFALPATTSLDGYASDANALMTPYVEVRAFAGTHPYLLAMRAVQKSGLSAFGIGGEAATAY